MGRFHRGLAVLLLAAGGFGCSIMDPDDRQELRDRMGVMPPEDILLMKRMVMNSKAINWLRGRPDNDQMGKLQCRYQAGGTWGQWTDQEPTFTVFEML